MKAAKEDLLINANSKCKYNTAYHLFPSGLLNIIISYIGFPVFFYSISSLQRVRFPHVSFRIITMSFDVLMTHII